jgi:hypothetical protein
MNITSIRRRIVSEAGGGRKLGCFSWAAAIFGAIGLLLLIAAVAWNWVFG